MVTYERAEGANAVASLPAGTLIAEFTCNGGTRTKRFVPVNVPAGTAASLVLPSIISVNRVRDPQGEATGPVHLRLHAAPLDEIHVMSPMTHVLDHDVSVVTASGTF